MNIQKTHFAPWKCYLESMLVLKEGSNKSSLSNPNHPHTQKPKFENAGGGAFVAASTAAASTFLGASSALWHPCARKKKPARSSGASSPAVCHSLAAACSWRMQVVASRWQMAGRLNVLKAFGVFQMGSCAHWLWTYGRINPYCRNLFTKVTSPQPTNMRSCCSSLLHQFATSIFFFFALLSNGPIWSSTTWAKAWAQIALHLVQYILFCSLICIVYNNNTIFWIFSIYIYMYVCNVKKDCRSPNRTLRNGAHTSVMINVLRASFFFSAFTPAKWRNATVGSAILSLQI